MGSQQHVPQQSTTLKPNGRPAPPPLATNGLGVNGQAGADGKGSGPGSANSQFSTLSFAMNLRQPAGGNSDPSSAISSVYSDRDGGVQMEREPSVNGLLPDLNKLSLEKGRPLDVEDLDDEGWHAASEQEKIVEMGSLGEGAGGAVTRCRLKDGKTVFALKVSSLVDPYSGMRRHWQMAYLLVLDHHHRPESRCEEADCPRAQLQQRLCLRAYLSLLRSLHGQVHRYYFNRHGILRRWKP